MKPRPMQRGPNSRYVPAEFKAQTLDELRERCGEHGAAAVEDARCFAASMWRAHQPDYSGGHELALYADHQRAKLRLPRLNNQPWRPALVHASPAERERVETTAHHVLAEWEAAGSPRLTTAIERTQKRVHCAVFAADQRREALAAVESILFPKDQPTCRT